MVVIKDIVKSLTEADPTIPKGGAEWLVNFIIGQIESALEDGEDVFLSGFGKFTVETRAARNGVNPQTGEKIQIAAKKVLKFKPAKAISTTINQ